MLSHRPANTLQLQCFQRREVFHSVLFYWPCASYLEFIYSSFVLLAALSSFILCFPSLMSCSILYPVPPCSQRKPLAVLCSRQDGIFTRWCRSYMLILYQTGRLLDQSRSDVAELRRKLAEKTAENRRLSNSSNEVFGRTSVSGSHDTSEHCLDVSLGSSPWSTHDADAFNVCYHDFWILENISLISRH